MSTVAPSDRQRKWVVVLGSFNPAIFHPLWFSRYKLIRDAEAESANVKVVSTEVTVIEAEWFSLEVTSERLVLQSRDPTKFLPLRDLAASTFALLEHMPVTAFGFNSGETFHVHSEDAWHKFGHHFSPKESWKELLEKPGLSVLSVMGKRPDCLASRIQISLRSAPNNGILVSINQHYDVKSGSSPGDEPATATFVAALERDWESFLQYSDRVGAHLLREGTVSV